MRVPEPVPYEEPPMQKPRSMPEQTKVFTPKAVIVFVLIILVILTLILVLVLTTTKSKKGKAFEIKVAPACAFLTPRCASAASFVTPPPPGSA